MNRYEITSGADFFYMSGNRICIFIDIELKEAVNREILQKAIGLTLKRFPFFAVRKKVSEDGSRYILEDNPVPVTVAEKNGYIPPDTEEVGYHLITASYWQNHIFVSVFHGLTDGGGGKIFVTTLIRAYYELLDGRLYPDSSQTDVRDEPQEAEYEDPYRYCRKVDAAFRLSKKEPFYFSPDDILTDGAKLYRFSIPEKTFVGFSKKFESGVSGLIALAMARAIDIIRRQDDKAIVISCPIDMRKILGCPKSMRNCTKSAKYSHTALLRSMSTDRQMSAIKGQMLLQSSEEYQLPRFNEEAEELRKLYALGDIGKILDIYSGGKKSLTPIVSYLGSIDFGELNDRVLDVNFYSKVAGNAGMQAVCLCYKGQCSVTVSSNLRNESYIRMFANEMQDFAGNRSSLIEIDYNAPAIHREEISLD